MNDPKPGRALLLFSISVIVYVNVAIFDPEPVHGQLQDVFWTGNINGDYSEPGNWNGPVPSTQNHAAHFDLAGSHSIVWTSGSTIAGSAFIDQGDFQFFSNGGPYTFFVGNPGILGTDFRVGEGAHLTLGLTSASRIHLNNVDSNNIGQVTGIVAGRLSVINGSRYTGIFTSVAGTGSIDVSGADATLDTKGLSALGDVSFTNGGRGIVSSLSIGTSSANAYNPVVEVTGAGSMIDVSSDYLGNTAEIGMRNGSLNVSAGGVVLAKDFIMGSNAKVEISGTGSRWENSGNLDVGGTGGLINVRSGAEVLTKGGALNGGANVLIENAGSHWNNNGSLLVGESGAATVSINSGGQMTSDRAFLGELSSGDGTVNVSGRFSNLAITGNLVIGNRGQGRLNISNRGVVTNPTARVGNLSGSSGAVTVSGFGSRLENTQHLNVGASGNGELTVQAGGTVNNNIGRLGINHGSLGVANIEGVGSRWNNSGTLNIGMSGTGVVNIRGGGNVNNTTGYAGTVSGTGTVNVTGLGSIWENQFDLFLGHASNGNLTVFNQGQVSNRNAVLANSGGSTATAIISGNGSSWDNQGNLVVGARGTAVLGVLNGGDVTSNGAIVAEQFGSTGVAQFDGTGTQWSNSGSLSIGKVGNGTLAIDSGARVDNLAAQIGDSSSGNGIAAVRGQGSRWTNNGGLTIGVDGRGEMMVESGGVVSNHAGSMAANRNSTAETTVIGTGSLWSSAGNLSIGGSFQNTGGEAKLNIFDGGRVDVLLGTTTIGVDSQVKLDGGSFNFSQMAMEDFSRINAIKGSMSGTVNNNQFLDVGTLTGLQGLQVDYSNVAITNNGTLTGHAIMNSGLTNGVGGEIQIASGDQMRFGQQVINLGRIGNNGGLLNVNGRLANRFGAFITGNGTIMASIDIANRGLIALSGDTNLRGDLAMLPGSRLITSGNSTTTIWDDLIHNGDEIRTNAGSATVIYGSASGTGAFTGAGTVYFEGDLDPGNSPGIMNFEGDVVLSNFADTTIEFEGLGLGEFDQLLVAGDLTLGGKLFIDVLDGFQMIEDTEFLIADIGGELYGQFRGLNEGDIVGTFSRYQFSISYQAGNGNDIALFASAVPEPSSAILLLIAAMAFSSNRRKRI